MSQQQLPLPSWATNEKLIKEYFLYGYQVNYDLAYMGFATYLIVAIVHTAVTLRWARKVWWMYLATLTGLLEAVGYWYRIESVERPSMAVTFVTFVAIIIPPIILAVVNYEVVGKLLKSTGKSLGYLSPKYMTRAFLGADITCFFVQCAALPLLLSKDDTNAKRGSYVVIFGLILQFVVFSTFVVVAVRTAQMPELSRAGLPKQIRRVTIICIVTIVLLLVRNVYRVYEYTLSSQQRDERYKRAIEYEEWEFYVFEWAPVWAVHAVFMLYNFGVVLPDDEGLAKIVRPDLAAQAGDGTVSVEGPAALELREVKTQDKPEGASGSGADAEGVSTPTTTPGTATATATGARSASVQPEPQANPV